MDATLHDPLVGRMLDARYRVEHRIAVGGMATVYRGLDTRLDRVVALKVMHPQYAADPEFVDRFIREAKSVARLSHVNVVNVFDQGSDHSAAPAVVFLAMEYVPGWTLRDLLRERGALSVRAALDILEPVLAALGAAHRAGLVHRDVKPENVLLTEDGMVKVADFGLARTVNGQAGQTAATTQVLGTVSYLAPEQIEHGAADPRTDVYAAGVVLYEMLTGAKPFTGESAAQVIFRHLSEDVPPPSLRAPHVPVQLDAITAAATARDPQRRPADAVELLARLQYVRHELTPAQLDAEPLPVLPAPAPGGVGPEDRTTAFGAPGFLTAPPGFEGSGFEGPGGVEHTRVLPPELPLPPDLVMPRHEIPEPLYAPPPPPPGGSAGRGRSGRRGGRPPRRRRRWLVPTAVLVLLAALAGGVTWALEGGLYTHVPGVLGLPQATAEARLKQAGFAVTSHQDFSPDVPKGSVIGTDPAPGARVRTDASIALDVSKGPQHPTVPQVSGKTRAQAERAIKDAGLAVGKASTQPSDSVPAGRAVGTDPAAGTRLSPDTVVNLVLSSGPQPIDLPNVVGEPIDQATGDLRDAGFQVRLSPDQVYSDQPAGSVATQSPDTATAQKDATVTLTVSRGPQLFPVPDVQGMSRKDAEAALKSAGFKTRVFDLGILGHATVHDQSPGANSQAPKGTTITLWLY